MHIMFKHARNLMFWLTVFSDAIKETEEIHLSEGRSAAKVTREELLADLKAANLESIGFHRYEKTTTETKADGTPSEKKVVGFRKQVLCSQEEAARRQMEERLPPHLFSRKLDKKADEDVKKDSAQLGERYCDVGIEVKLPNGGRKRFFFFFFAIVIVIG